MVNTEELILLDENYYISKKRFDEATEMIKNHREGISLGEFRDKLNTSRKSALLLLDYMDSRGITYKSGDLRYINM